MPRQIYLMRHGAQETLNDGTVWEPAAKLTTEGELALQRVRYRHLQGLVFALCGHSPLVRARETAWIMAPADTRIIEFPDLGPSSEKAWSAFRGANEPDVKSAFELQPDLLIAEGQRVWGRVWTAAHGLAPGGRALLVSHQPLVECAAAFGEYITAEVAHCERYWPPKYQLAKGEILVFAFEDDALEKIEHLALAG